jgi:cell division septum initiation protein DivIVA
VNAGVKTDDETTGKAFTGAKAQYQADTYDAEQNAAGKRKGADQRWDEASKAAGTDQAKLDRLKAAHDAEVAQIEADLPAEKSRIQAAFAQNLNELFAGLAQQNPELQASLASAFEKLDIAQALQEALDNGTPEAVLNDSAHGAQWIRRWVSNDPAGFLQSAMDTKTGRRGFSNPSIPILLSYVTAPGRKRPG